MEFAIWLLIAAMTAPPPAPSKAPQSLTRGEVRAISVAEQFISENGYTMAPPDVKRMRPAFGEQRLPTELLVRVRRGRLKPKAYGISPQQGPNRPGWTVFFEFTAAGDNLAGVEMSPDLRRMWMCHYELRRDAVAKVVPRTDAASQPRR